jgi:hypothetical protein
MLPWPVFSVRGCLQELYPKSIADPEEFWGEGASICVCVRALVCVCLSNLVHTINGLYNKAKEHLTTAAVPPDCFPATRMHRASEVAEAAAQLEALPS